MKTVAEACLHPENYRYALSDRDELLEAVIRRYKDRYHTDIEKMRSCPSTVPRRG